MNAMYQSSVPVFVRYLNNLSELLVKAKSYAEDKKFEVDVLLNSRLFADMLPLTRQVQLTCDFAKGTVARLTQVDNPAHADTENSIEELQARIEKTLVFIKSIPKEQFQTSAELPIKYEIKRANISLDFTGESYLTQFALPNFYFHCVTAYNILRHNGVALGKQDYLGTW